ncbi:hypothetical protein PB1_04270 [Bacillus methanolicus PB1]|uniref:Uncharacterized protein n=1 Tax=Bacillus methanolicus PB1 TaxID=997296 RepID=I3E6K1_BACMT|nr:hypothetical protein PB1_04270 [Bacillus methanolicus PB1]
MYTFSRKNMIQNDGNGKEMVLQEKEMFFLVLLRGKIL